MSGPGPDAGVYAGCAIPPDVHAHVFGWDPAPEIDRLLFLAGEAGAPPQTALELGCGTGRLLAPLAARGVEVTGLELSAPAAEYAARRSGRPVLVGDMTHFAVAAPVDLVHLSANTLRHVVADEALAAFWPCVAAALRPGGAFVADLEFGLAHERSQIGVEHAWELQHDEHAYRGVWRVLAVDSERPVAHVEWVFQRRGGAAVASWSERFDLRVHEADALLAGAASAGLRGHGIFECRDPYLHPVRPAGFGGRALVVLTR